MSALGSSHSVFPRSPHLVDGRSRPKAVIHFSLAKARSSAKSELQDKHMGENRTFGIQIAGCAAFGASRSNAESGWMHDFKTWPRAL
jgi:hypothetical protein